jgi:isocitrate dehydrogenase
MFEAIHGTAPDIAGQGIANPSGLILASVLMLQHLGLVEHAELIYNAWAATIEAGIHTKDIAISKSVSSQEFTNAVISNLGNQPKTLKKASFKAKLDLNKVLAKNYQFEEKNFEGVDVFIEFRGPVEQLAEKLILSQQNFSLKLISNRGLLIWPQKTSDIDPVDQFRCRFLGKNQDDVPNLLTSLQRLGVQVLKVEYLFSFNGRRAYSLAQGE